MIPPDTLYDTIVVYFINCLSLGWTSSAGANLAWILTQKVLGS